MAFGGVAAGLAVCRFAAKWLHSGAEDIVTSKEIAELVEGKIVTADSEARNVEFGFASDLMSDVLTLTEESVLFITGLATTQTIRTAVISDIEMILLVRGKRATKDMVAAANADGIVLIESPYSMYRASGTLYAAGLKAVF